MTSIAKVRHIDIHNTTEDAATPDGWTDEQWEAFSQGRLSFRAARRMGLL